jgi:hypothetical protein
MKSQVYVSLGEQHGTEEGGGPESYSPQGTSRLRAQGFLALALGFAAGLTLVLLFLFFRLVGAPTPGLQLFVSQINPNLWWSFLVGLIGGTLLAAIYNLLVIRHLNLFGLDSRLD